MKKSLIVLLSIVGVIVVFGLYSLFVYNRLITLNEQADNQWAQVENQYQRRFDLIPNLVEAVKGTMKQEQTIFSAIAEARTKYAGASNVNEKTQAATEMDSALSRLLVIMENYPQLKSAENVQTLMAQLEGTENRVSVERNRYNETARNFNMTIKRIPTKWFANMMGFSPRSYFEAQAGAENAPKVQF